MGNAGSQANGPQGSTSLEPLNAKDLELVKASWADLNKEELGISIMVRIFQEHKEIKGKWIFATNLETEAEMQSNSQVRYHAKKIMDVIAKIIEKVDSTTDPSRISIDDMNLVRLGRSHYHYTVRREHFYHFEESLLFALKKCTSDKNELSKKTEMAWRKVFWLIANAICEGIEKEMKEKEGNNHHHNHHNNHNNSTNSNHHNNNNNQNN